MKLETEDALLSGIPIGAGQLAHCDCCNVCLRPNHRVEILVTIVGTQIDVATTRCAVCSQGSLSKETERPCLLARGRVAASVSSSGRSKLILSGASVVDRAE
ncbi:hypothetical protein [Natronorubrum daqingense]|uniref:Uncharacterized protein n=1 Tax=Natronorubrum daqingense TaxID=588898 RepID=A0A1N7G4C3_9EURY|nr:hypothetical protein [Natronorubrum daqingense]APX98742.1 hypothetical protein BB347_18730 [Natronorubrum daqingense]SIS07439.1 hypothetical protein SAMN05421809_3710 [Natronorubrum daqingense]